MAQAYLEFSEWGSAAGTKQRFDFPFNPDQLQMSQGAKWNDSDSSTSSEYENPTRRSMTIKIFLDERAKPDARLNVVSAVDLLLSACRPTQASISQGEPLPPRVKFGWDRVHIDGYVDSVSANYLLFSPDGRPIRAECDVSLKEGLFVPAGQNPTSGTPNIHRTVEVVVGDHLAHVAYREYGKPSLWRAIAELNGVDDPLRVSPGTPLLVPRTAQAAGRS